MPPKVAPEEPFPGATPEATAEIAKLAARHGMTTSDYLNWKFSHIEGHHPT